MKRIPIYRHAAPCALSSLLILMVACSASTGVVAPAQPPQAMLSHTLTLGAGQSAQLRPGATLTLERINDSRCKTGAVCVWAGYISYTFKLDSNTGSATFVLSEAMPGGQRTQSVEQLTFTLVAVDPELPPAAKGPAPNYRVTVKVAAI